MSKKSKNEQLEAAAKVLGVPVGEVVDVYDHDHGTVIITTDGVSYINVDADHPDADGQTGLMYLAKPHAGEAPVSFPVFAQRGADEDLEDEAQPEEQPAGDKPELDVPDGNIKMVTGWVQELGADHVVDRASKALEAEQAKPKPRPTLVEELQALIDATQPAGDKPELTDEELAALEALSEDDVAALEELSDDDVEALAALTGEELDALNAGD